VQPLTEAWNGSSWEVEPITPPVEDTVLNAVSCGSGTACLAVGSSGVDRTSGTPYSAAWNGSHWTAQAVPDPAGAEYTELTGVSCTSPTACSAVGYYDNGSVYVPLAESWSAGTWAIDSTPSPAGSGNSYFLGLSCTSSTFCVAVGYSVADVSPYTTSPLAETWNGESWTLQTAVGPDIFSAVACASTVSCMAVGDRSVDTLAGYWNGSDWTAQTTPEPTGAYETELTAVSCVSATACTAVGLYNDNPERDQTLAESWDGAAWAIQSTPDTTGVNDQDERGDNQLSAVSCVAADTCTAVGVNAHSGTLIISS
jgi:hypothetical protein